MTVKKTRTANKAEATIKRLKLDQLRTDGGVRCRIDRAEDELTIKDYSEAMKDNEERFPPVKARFDGTDYWLWDGFLRLEATRKAKLETIEVEVTRGTKQDAKEDAIGANTNHGLPRTNADKREAVSRALKNEKWIEWSRREIAKYCNVSHPLVNKMWPSGNRFQTVKFKRNGKEHIMKPSRKRRTKKLTEEAIDLLGNTDFRRDAKGLERLASVPRDVQVLAAKLIASGVTNSADTAIQKVKREARTEQLNKELPDLSSMGPFRTIMIDPPWKMPPGGRFSADSHYCTMTVEEIERKVPVAKIAADDAHLYLWTIQDFIFEAFELVRRWGFEFKTMITWVKTDKDGEPRIGAGHHFRYCTEFVLFAERGNVPAQQQSEPNVILAPRREHSQKPDQAFEMAERVSLEPRLEVFSRTDREGWTTWGDQAGSLGKRSKAPEPDTLERAA